MPGSMSVGPSWAAEAVAAPWERRPGPAVGPSWGAAVPLPWQPALPVHGVAPWPLSGPPAAEAPRAAPEAVGLRFPAEAEDPKERRRRQQQEMHSALARQIEQNTAARKEEERHRKEQDERDEARVRQESDSVPDGAAAARPSRRGLVTRPVAGQDAQSFATAVTPSASSAARPRLFHSKSPDQDVAVASVVASAMVPADAEKERKRRQLEEFQRDLALQVEESKQRKRDEERRRQQEDAREEERLHREIEEDQKRMAAAQATLAQKNGLQEAQGEKRMRQTRDKLRESKAEGRDKLRESVSGEMGRIRSDEPLRESGGNGMRKTRERMRESRGGRQRRPRTMDRDRDRSIHSPKADAQSPTPGRSVHEALLGAPGANFMMPQPGAMNTAGTWFRSGSPVDNFNAGGRAGELTLGMHGFVEQQMQLATEMQRQVEELRRQRDEARELILKVREDALNDRATSLQELHQSLLEQIHIAATPATAPPAMQQAYGFPASEDFLAAPSGAPAGAAMASRRLVTTGESEVGCTAWERSFVSSSRFVALDVQPFTTAFLSERTAADAALRFTNHNASELRSPGVQIPAGQTAGAGELYASLYPAKGEDCQFQIGSSSGSGESGDKTLVKCEEGPTKSRSGGSIGSDNALEPTVVETPSVSDSHAPLLKLGQDKVAEFRWALDHADGLDPELKEGLVALLSGSGPASDGSTVPGSTTSAGSVTSANSQGKPPSGRRGEAPEVSGSPYFAVATRPRISEARRARSSTPNIGFGSSCCQPDAKLAAVPERIGEERRARSAMTGSRADDARSHKVMGPGAGSSKPATAPGLARAGEARRRISDERRSQSAAGIHPAPTLAAATQPSNAGAARASSRIPKDDDALSRLLLVSDTAPGIHSHQT